jgi:stearoyl-CoA desaturase (delta-9 desaturase)
MNFHPSGFDIWQTILNFLAQGLTQASVWQVIIFTLVVTHITIASVTIFLHRSQAHRSLELHAIPSHFFRFWLWLTTGMVTKEWVAIHRKHHAKCETSEDPHSPQTRGIRKVLLEGSELYRAEAKNQETLDKYGHNTPNDWIEKNLYTKYSRYGVVSMFIINVLLFGALGVTVWAIQMIWIPVTAAGIINGLAHWWGYRNFEAADASTNISPIGLLIGGEELHNNHHTYPTSAKLSVKPFEFDIGWGYIRILEILKLATVRKVAPVLKLKSTAAPTADHHTLEALIHYRYEVMAHYAKALKHACASEIQRLREQGHAGTERFHQMMLARRWLPRDTDKIPSNIQPKMQDALASSAVLSKLIHMREELRLLWTQTHVSREQLVADLQAWCHRAEQSGIQALQDLSLRLKAAHI